MTKEELEIEFEEAFDKNTAATGGGYEANYTEKWLFYRQFEPHIYNYAKQEAIEFFRFATIRFTRLTGDVWIEKVDFGPGTKWLSTEDLYAQFIQSKETNNG